jgi:hypothetical protein
VERTGDDLRSRAWILSCLVFTLTWAMDETAHFPVSVSRDAEQKNGNAQDHDPTQPKNDPKQHSA